MAKGKIEGMVIGKCRISRCDPQESSASTNLDAIIEGLSVRARNVLSTLEVDSQDALLGLTHEQLLRSWSCGKKTAAEIERLQATLRETQNRASHQKSENTTPTFDDAPKAVFEAVKGTLSVRGLHTLENLRTSTMKDFMSLEEEQLLKCRHCGRKTAKEIMRIQNDVVKFATDLADKPSGFCPEDLILAPCFLGTSTSERTHEEPDFFADMENPALWLRNWVQGLSRSKRQARAFMLRKGMLGFAPLTLDRVGEQIGSVTRERARQMEKAVEERAAVPHQQQRLRPLIQAVVAVVNECGGLVGLDELTQRVLCKGENGGDLRFASDILRFFATLPVWTDAGLHLHKGGIVSCGNSRAKMHHLAAMVEDTACAGADENHGDGLWSIDRQHLKSLLINVCKGTLASPASVTLSDAALDAALNLCRRDVRSHGERVYSVRLWKLRFGNVVQMTETVLRQIGGPAHFREVAKHINKWREGFSINNTHAALDRCDNALLWDLGTFVHQDNIAVPLSLIHDAEAWLLTALKEDVPFVSANGAFLHFKTRCERAGFPSDVALYSCLRQSAHPALVYPRLPCVYLKQGFTDRLPILLALEEFLRDSGGPVSQQELKEFALKKLYLKDNQFSQLSQRVANVIRTADWGYVHLDNFEVKDGLLQSIVQHTQAVLAKEGHCSVDKIYRDKRVTCSSASIAGPVMLYSLLQCFADESFALDGYPRIASRANGDATDGRTIRERVINFVREAGSPCPFELMEEHLVRQLGYKEQQIYSVTREPSVCIYHPGCVVHLESLGWSEAKQSALEQSALRFYTAAVKAGRCYGRVSHLVESDDLPSLPSGFHWSCPMIADLLAKGRRFLVIGNCREVFVPTDNQTCIRTVEDLVASLLTAQWGGAANLAKFVTALVQAGVIKKHLTPTMLSPGNTVAIQDGEILLKELLIDA